MISIKSVSDLRNYNSILEKAVKLMADLLEGRESGEKEEYISIDDIRKKYK